jgi:phospholipid/cholesterol/gamma-HCH transport system permease protein
MPITIAVKDDGDYKSLVITASGNLTQRDLPVKIKNEAPSTANIDQANISQAILDFSRVTELDTSGANALLIELDKMSLATASLEITGINENHKKLLELVRARTEIINDADTVSRTTLKQKIAAIGQKVAELYQIKNDYISLVGQFLFTFFAYVISPKKIRHREIFSQIEQTAIKAIPVVMLVTLLIGVVVAYLLAMQAEKFGASIFVVDGVAIAMCREMSPILVAIIVAGRSGSAFAAQLGTMKLTEEVDAIKSIGLKPFDVLVFPRILSLLLAMPLLVFVGNIVGIFGGMLITESYLGLTYHTFLTRLESVLTLKHISVGLIKAPVFAMAIGLIACRTGLTTAKDARSVGLSTTKTVVQSIVVVILLNAAFAVIFAELDI